MFEALSCVHIRRSDQQSVPPGEEIEAKLQKRNTGERDAKRVRSTSFCVFSRGPRLRGGRVEQRESTERERDREQSERKSGQP